MSTESSPTPSDTAQNPFAERLWDILFPVFCGGVATAKGRDLMSEGEARSLCEALEAVTSDVEMTELYDEHECDTFISFVITTLDTNGEINFGLMNGLRTAWVMKDYGWALRALRLIFLEFQSARPLFATHMFPEDVNADEAEQPHTIEPPATVIKEEIKPKLDQDGNPIREGTGFSDRRFIEHKSIDATDIDNVVDAKFLMTEEDFWADDAEDDEIDQLDEEEDWIICK